MSNILDKVGPALFGERWKAPLATALGISVTTLSMWRTLPDKQLRSDAIDKCQNLLDKRLTLIEEAGSELQALEITNHQP